MSILRNVFRPAVTNPRELRAFVLSVAMLAWAVALTVDVVKNLLFFNSWTDCLTSWTVTTVVAVGLAFPIARAIGGAHLELYRAKREADRLGRTDPLTGLLNRRALYEAAAPSNGGAMALVIADIDRFKRVNDRYGHRVGDEMIQVVARVMSEELGSFGTVARLGGEEFALFCRDRGTDEICERVARFVELVARTPALVDGAAVYVTVSAGVASARDADFDALYSAADRALYIAKANGRNRVVNIDQLEGLAASFETAVSEDFRRVS